MSGERGPGSGEDPAALEEEVERLRAERDKLRRSLDRSEDVAARGGRTRRTTVVVLIVLATLTLAAGIPGIWAARNAMDTDEYLEIVAPLGSDPVIARELAERITTELFVALDVEQVIAGALPERARFLAGPLSNAIHGFVRDQVQTVLASDAFERLWIEANRFAHQQLVAVLRDESDAVSTTDGRVVLNLLPVINAALAQLQTSASNLVGRNVTLPTLDSSTLPEEARTRIESALGITLPADFGEIVIFDDDRLRAAQDGIVTAQRLLWLLVIVFVLSIAGALALSRRRRRTLIQLSSALLIVIVAERRLARIGEADIADRVTDPGARAAVRVTAQALLDDFLDATVWLAVGLLVVLLIALITGPYPWAVALRARAGHVGRLAGDALTGMRARAGDESTLAWIARHLPALQLAGIAVGLALLVFLSTGWIGFLLIVGLTGLYELVLWRIGGAADDSADARGSATAPPA